LTFGSPVVGDHLFPIYWFGIYANAGHFIRTGINPMTGSATFLSDDDPGVVDDISRFGEVRWFEPGFNQCPEEPTAVEEATLGRVRATYK
jgi:hypothetical protein